MEQRRFRFGIQFAAAGTRQEWKERARKAEALGYDVLVMPDHLGGQFAIGPALMAVTDATTKLRIGTLVLQNELRHPALVAQEAATLDVLSDGRFELGLGAGGSLLADYERTGIPFVPASARASRLAESVHIIKGLLADGPINFTGQHYRITDLDGQPKPIQRPHPPILIGAGGRRMLSFAAREADIVSIFPMMAPSGGRFEEEELLTPAVAKKVELLRQSSGKRRAPLELNIHTQKIIITDNRRAAVARLSAEWGEPADKWLDSPYIYLGSIEQIADDLRFYRDQLGISYVVVRDEYLDAFAPVVAQLAGR